METLPLVTTAVVLAAIVGTVQAIKPFFDPKLSTAERTYAVLVPVIAALLGLLAGAGHLVGLTPIAGMFYGLAAVGAHAVITNS